MVEKGPTLGTFVSGAVVSAIYGSGHPGEKRDLQELQGQLEA